MTAVALLMTADALLVAAVALLMVAVALLMAAVALLIAAVALGRVMPTVLIDWDKCTVSVLSNLARLVYYNLMRQYLFESIHATTVDFMA
jgi:hypothetical protein